MTAATADATDEDEREELFGADDFDDEDKLVALELFTITPPAVGALEELEDLIVGVEEDVREADVVGIGDGESEAAED